jgi:phosphoadenosine phosphosulfate reductase
MSPLLVCEEGRSGSVFCGKLRIREHENALTAPENSYLGGESEATRGAGGSSGCVPRGPGGQSGNGAQVPPPAIADQNLPAIRTATPEELEAFSRQSLALEGATPEEIIAWAVKTYFPKLTMATAFGPEGCVILSMLAKIQPKVYVFNLETGYQFPETLQLRDKIAQRYGIEVDYQSHETPVAEYEKLNGGPVYKSDPDRCCFDRKVTVLHRVARKYDAWMSGIRRDQSPHRAGAPIVGWDKKFGLVKISPLASWTKKDVWKRITDEQIPYNSLHDKGYTSIGCWPCTRAVLFGEDERAGRWSGTAKTECGLHTSE